MPKEVKAPLTGFFMFSASIRESLKAKNPEAKMTDLGRLAGEAWKALSEAERGEWVAKSKAAKEAHEKEHGKVVRAPKAKAVAKAGAKSKGDKADGPKRAVTAFMHFATANRAGIIAANPGVSFGEVGKLMGAAWKALDADGKKKYEDLAAKDKARYEAEKA